MSSGSSHRVLLIGCDGGVGRAVLSLLRQHRLRGRQPVAIEQLYLVDRTLRAEPVDRGMGVWLPRTTIRSGEDLARLVRDYRITQVIDLSSLDTLECAAACDREGADYLTTSIEEWAGAPPLTTVQSIARAMPPHRPALPHRSHLIGSGANPGIVNALVFTALDEFAKRAGVDPTAEALELYSILVTEEDTTTEQARDDVNTFAMTWSPWHCLEELFEPAAFVGSYGQVKPLDHAPTDRVYRARCGHVEIEGLAVPHEEVATLARRFDTVEEIGFIYRLPPAARGALAAHPQLRKPELWPTRRLWPPWTEKLRGQDRIGVLLGSRRHGELWMGFETDVSNALPLGMNATQLQVAAGVLSGWEQLGRRRGIHFVEDLDCNQFVASAARILGRPLVVHDPAAPPRRLNERVVARTDPFVAERRLAATLSR